MPAILINYNYTPDWLLDYPNLSPVTIYDRSDDGIERDLGRFGMVIKTANSGQVDYDKLSYLVDNYDTLPEVFLWGKTNLFKFITKEEYDQVKDNKVFTPLLTQKHHTYGDVCYYQDGMYHEVNSSWYVDELSYKYFNNFSDFAKCFHIPNPRYIPFAPGGNYILTKEAVYKHSRDLYDDMRQCLPHAINPAEAHMCERSYNLIWRG